MDPRQAEVLQAVPVPEHLQAQYLATTMQAQAAQLAHREMQKAHRKKVAKQKKEQQKAQQDAGAGVSEKAGESSVFLNDSGDQGAAHVAENARYSQYRPQQLDIGFPHPDHIVESSSLAAATPPKVWYDCKQLRGEYENKIISNAQLETVVYALQRFSGPRLDGGYKAGFFLGDGAGVGKGRQISALIKEMWRKGTRRILWLSHCKDLREDARRDMVDCDITVPSSSRKPVNMTKKVKIEVWPSGNKAVPTIKGNVEKEFKEGVFFATYQLLIAGCKGVGKATKKYARADGTGEGGLGHIHEEGGPQIEALEKPGTRFMQILEWLKGDTSESGPLIVFDECHKAKNLMNEQGNPTLTGVAVRHIQDKLPSAGILYSSATGISEPNNMAYMVRLGNFGHKSMTDLIKSLIESGLGASELFSCSLKSQGIYVARQLSYDGAEFELKMIDLGKVFQVQYGRAAAMWQLLDMLVGKKGCWDATAKRMMTAFWGDHLRFFKSMLMASKVEALAEEARISVQNDYSVVIGLQSTGEASLQAEKAKQGGDSMDNLFSAPKVQICRVVDKYLSDSPCEEHQEMEVLREMSEVVSALICFADHMLEAGTAAEYASKLMDRMKQDAEDRKIAWQEMVEEKRARREERQARGEEADSDLEDDEEVEAAPEDNDEAHHSLLSCMSLSKMVVDYGNANEGTKPARALKALITNMFNTLEAETWALSQTEMEDMLNQTYQKLEAEEQRREKNNQEIKALEVQRVWGVKVQDAQKVVDEVMEKMSDLESRVRHPASKKRGLVSIASTSKGNKHAIEVKSSAETEMLEDSDEEEVEVHEKKETKKGKAAAAVSDDEDDDSDSGDESDAVSEEYDPDVSDDDMAAPPSSADARRSQRERKAKTSRQLVLDSDDDCAADASPVSGKGKRASCDDLEEEIDKDDEMEVEADADADKDEPVGLTWPADVRRNRSSRSRSSRSLSGGSSTPASLSTMPRARNLPEQLSTMTMSGGSVKRGCSAIDRRSLQQNDTKRLCMDLSEAASKAGMSVDELHSLAAAEPAEEDPEAAEDIECMECTSKEDEDNMLICDWCQLGVHLYCHKPGLKDVPDEDTWYCHNCTPIVEKQKVAKEILQRHQEACATAGVAADEKVNAMADMLAGVGVADDTTMNTGTMVSAAGDADAYTCVTSPCKTAPGVKQSNATSKEEAPAPSNKDADKDEEDMSDGEFDKENQAAKESKPVLHRAESTVSASTNNKLDVAAAKAGGAMSAAAVFSLAKSKKKSKKGAASCADTTTVASASACTAPSSSKGAVSASADLKERSGSVKMKHEADVKGKDTDTDTQMLSVLEVDEEEEKPVDDGKMDPDSIEHVTAKRKLGNELDGAKKRLKQVKDDMKRAQNNASRQRAAKAASDDEDSDFESPRARTTKNSRRRALEKDFELPSESEAEEFDDSGSEYSMDADDDVAPQRKKEDKNKNNSQLVPAPARLTLALMDSEQTRKCRDMTKVTGIRYNYEERVYPPGYPNEPATRPPHPVTVKAKLVLKKLIDLLELPANPLDNLIHLCGGREVVAEMTGRKEMMEMQADGTFRSVKRADGCAQQALNLTEKNKFMDGEKHIAIISEAASTGISLQADKKRINNKRRIHLTLELPWSADKAIQQFGRSHRSNQISAPVYKMLMTPAAGEFRFASSAAKRLQSLGAILKGNRDALGAGQNLKEFDIDNKYGQKAMNQFIGELTGCKSPHGAMLEGKFVIRIAAPQIPEHLECPDTLPEGKFNHLPEELKAFYNCARTWCAQAGVLDRNNMNVSVDGGAKHVKKLTVLLNRLLGMNLQQQQIVFGYLQQLIDQECETAKQNGTFDKGVLFLEGNVKEVDRKTVWRSPKAGGGEMVMSTLMTDVGLTYDEACEIVESNKDQLEKYGSNMNVREVGFYIRKQPQNCLGSGMDKIVLITGRLRHAGESKHVQATTRTPWDNNAKSSPMYHLKVHWKLCKDEKAAERLWNHWYNYTETNCMHAKPCQYKQDGHCGYYCRQQRVKVLHGSLLHAWDRILHTNCQGMYREEEDDHGKIRRKKAEDGDPVEMVSTTFTNAAGEQQTVTGMYVRIKIHDHLVDTLRSHEKTLRMTLKAQGIRVVDAEMQAAAGKAGPSHAAAAQQAADMMKELEAPAWQPNVLQPAADVDNKPPVARSRYGHMPLPQKKSLFGSSMAKAMAVERKAEPVPKAEPKAAVQPARAVPAVKNDDGVVDISSSESDDENNPGCMRLSKAELQALIKRRQNRTSTA